MLSGSTLSFRLVGFKQPFKSGESQNCPILPVLSHRAAPAADTTIERWNHVLVTQGSEAWKRRRPISCKSFDVGYECGVVFRFQWSRGFESGWERRIAFGFGTDASKHAHGE